MTIVWHYKQIYTYKYMSGFKISSHTSLSSTSMIMRSLSQTHQNTILSMLNSGHSAHSIASTTGIHVSTISRLRSKHCSTLQKPVGGCPSKLSSSNIRHAIHLISTGKAENAVQVTKALSDITNTPLHPNTVCQHLKKNRIEGCSQEETAFFETQT